MCEEERWMLRVSVLYVCSIEVLISYQSIAEQRTGGKTSAQA